MLKKRVITFFVIFVFAITFVFPVSASTTKDGYLFSVFEDLILARIRFSNCTYSNYSNTDGVIALTIKPNGNNWAMWLPIGNTPFQGYSHVTASAFAVYSPYNVTVSGSSDVYIAPGLIYSNSGSDYYIVFSQNGNSQILEPYWRCDIPAVSGGNNQFFNYYYVIYGNVTNNVSITITINNYKLSAMLRLYDMTDVNDQRSFMSLYTQQISNVKSTWTTGDVSGMVDDVGDIATAISKIPIEGGKSAYASLDTMASDYKNRVEGPGGVRDQLKTVDSGYAKSVDDIASKALGVVPFVTILGNFIKNNWLLSAFIGVSVALLLAGYVINMLRRDK